MGHMRPFYETNFNEVILKNTIIDKNKKYKKTDGEGDEIEGMAMM